MSTVFSPATAHLATGPWGWASKLGRPPRSERAEPPSEASAGRRRDPFRAQRARHGPGAGFRWWQRLGAAAALLALIGALGLLLAALVGFVAFVGGIVLEALIG
ncbi:MAG: hypothetical protein OXG47_06305 [bacterium]|nr:hypothetical protein [bacterium]